MSCKNLSCRTFFSVTRPKQIVSNAFNAHKPCETKEDFLAKVWYISMQKEYNLSLGVHNDSEISRKVASGNNTQNTHMLIKYCFPEVVASAGRR